MGGGGRAAPPPALEMTDDAVNDFVVGSNRDDLHFRTTFSAQEWVHLKHFSDQACPIGPAGFGGCGTRSRVLGFTRASGHRILWVIGRFNDFALSLGVQNARRISERLVERFLKEGLTSDWTRRNARSAMRHLLEHLREEDVIPKKVVAHPEDPFDPLLVRYDDHLTSARCSRIAASNAASGSGSKFPLRMR